MARLDSSEIRYTARSLVGSPGFTVVAILSLALGIGANTAIFSAIQSILYARLPVESPEELVFLYRTAPRGLSVTNYNSSNPPDPESDGRLASNVSYPIFERLREATAGSDIRLAGFNFARGLSVEIDDRPAITAAGLLASGTYFSTLRLPAVLGRPLTPEDDRPGAPPTAVISHGFWQRQLGGDPEAIGRVLRINGTPFEVVGVTPAEFRGLSPGGFFPPTDITLPLSLQPLAQPGWPEGLLTSDEAHWVRLLGRIPSGTVPDSRLAELSASVRDSMLAAGVVEEGVGEEIALRALSAARGLDTLRQDVERPLQILAWVVAAVLLVGCANLASLTLARGATRRRELAVRRALGAGRGRLVRQLFLEGFMLSAAGGLLGLGLALQSGPSMTRALTAGFGRVDIRFELDWTILAIAATASVIAAVLAGLLPAIRTTRSMSSALSGASRGGDSRFTVGRVLVVGQIALSIPLVVGAGLFLRTAANLDRVDPGFDTEGLLLFRIDPTVRTTDPAEVVAIYDQVLERVESLSRVRSATLIENVLLSGWVSSWGVRIDGEERSMHMNSVGPDFFETMGLPLVAGRPVSGREGPDAPSVAVVNETAARELFGGRALGRTFVFDDRQLEVVGVVGDAKYSSLRSGVPPTFYDPYRQRGPVGSLHVALRFDGPSGPLEAAIREAVASVDRAMPVTNLRTQSDQILASTSRERIFSRMLAVFGVFALLVACIGLYGVTAFTVARRRGEIGVRLAIGSSPGQVLWLVLRQVLMLTGIGVAMGLGTAYLLGPVVASMLYGLAPTDPATLITTAGLLAAVAILAGWLPALRAARTDAVAELTRVAE